MKDQLLREGPEFQKRMSELIARAWADHEYKSRLLKDPKATLKDAGLDAPEEVEVVFLEDTHQRKHLVLPSPPQMRDLSDTDLARIAARKLEAQLTLF